MPVIDRKTADLMVSDWPAFERGLSDAQRQTLESVFKFETDRPEAQRRLASVAQIAASTGADVEDVSRRFETWYMPAFTADQKVGLGRIEGVDNFHQFYGLLTERVQKTNALRSMLESVGDAAEKSALLGGDGLADFAAWQKQWPADKFPTDKASDVWQKVRSDTLSGLGPDGSAVAGRAVRAMRREAGTAEEGDSWMNEAKRNLINIRSADRKKYELVLRAIQLRADAGPKDAGKSTPQGMGENFARAVGSIAEGSVDLMAIGGARLAEMGLTNADDPKALAEHNRAMVEVDGDIRDMIAGHIDPVSSNREDWLKYVENSLYIGSGSAPYMLAPFVPGGWAAIAGSFSTDAYRTFRKNGWDSGSAEVAALGSGVFQAGVEHLSELAIKIPGVAQLLSNWGFKPGSSWAAQFLLRSLARAGVEFGEETIQEATDPAIQELAHVISDSVPDTPEGKKLKDVMGRFFEKENSLPLLLSVLPLGMLGAGVSTKADQRVVDAVTRNNRLLRAVYSEEAAAEIEKETDPDKRLELLKKHWVATPTETIVKRANEIYEQDKKDAAEAARALDAAERLELIPKIRSDKKGWMVIRGDQVVRVGSRAEATQLAFSSLNDLERQSAEATAQMAEEFFGSGEEVEISQKPQTVADEVEAGRVTPEQAQRRVELFGQMQGLNAEEAKAEALAVLGNNRVEMIDNVRKAVSRIFGGGNLITVMHEGIHGRWRAALETGRHTHEDGLAWVRMAERASGAQFLPTLDDASVTPQMLDEAIVETAVADIVGRRKDGSRFSPGLISRGVSSFALAQRAEAKRAGKYVTFLKAWREFWGKVLGAAKKMQRARLDGKLTTDFDTFLDGLLDVSPQEMHEAAASSEALEIGEEMPFSLRLKPGDVVKTEAGLAEVYSVDHEPNGLWIVFKEGWAKLYPAKPAPGYRDFAPGLQWPKVVAPDEAEAYRSGDGNARAIHREREALEDLRDHFTPEAQESDLRSEAEAQEREPRREPLYRVKRAPGVKASAVRVGDHLRGLGTVTAKRQDGLGYWFDFDNGNGAFFNGESRVTRQGLPESRAVPIGTATVTEMPDGALLVGPTSFSITAYHGTPHSVDRFTTDKIGTGEGAQAYGWGLYFAENKSVAEMYAKAYARGEITNSLDLAKIALSIETGGKASAIASIRALDIPGLSDSSLVDDAVRLIEEDKVGPLGNTYTVELLPDEDEFLDWDKPLSEQSEEVRKAFADLMSLSGAQSYEAEGSKVYLDVGAENEMTGAVVYQRLDGSTPEKKSKALAALGIPGIKFLDGNSRTKGEGTRNYVIFDEKLVRILEENGRKVGANESEATTYSLRPRLSEEKASALVRAWQAVTAQDEAFQYGKTDSPNSSDIARAVSTPRKPLVLNHFGNSIRVKGMNGFLDIMAIKSDRPYINSIDADSAGDSGGGGSQLYQAALDWIHNNGKQIRDDPQGLSEINAVRRTSNFFASALRWGTAKHLKPHEDQHVPWSKTSDIANIAALAVKEMSNALKVVAAAKKWRYDFANERFVDSTGRELTGDQFREAVVVEDPATSGIGVSTLRRAVLTASALQEFEGGKLESIISAGIDAGRAKGPLAGITYSLAPRSLASVADTILAAKMRRPEFREKLLVEARRRMAKIRQDGAWRVDRFGRAFQREGADSMADRIRTPKSIEAERKFRKRSRQRELIEQGMANLTDATRMAYESGLTKLEDHPLISAMLDDHGRLMSRTTAEKEGRLKTDGTGNAGDYDGAPWLPPKWFSKSGGFMPDQMAQRLYEQGLIADAHADTLWDALRSVIEGNRSNNEAVQKANEAVRDIEAKALQQAQDESEKWAKDERAKVPSAKDRQMMALRTLDAILSAFPPDIRGRVGGFVQLAALGSDEGREKEIARRLDFLDEVIEREGRKHFAEEMKKLLKRTEPKREAGKKPKGKLGADVHALFETVKQAMDWTGERAEAHAAGLEAEIASGNLTPAQEAHAQLEAAAVRLVADWYSRTENTGKQDKRGRDIYKIVHEGADAARMEAAVKNLTEIWEHAYAEQRLRQTLVREQREKLRKSLIRFTRKTGSAGERDARAIKDNGFPGWLEKIVLGLLNFEQALKWVFGESCKEALALADWQRRAENQKEDAIQAKVEAIDKLFTDLAGGKLAGEKLRWKMGQKTVRIEGRILSQLELVSVLGFHAQSDGRRHMEGHLDEAGKPVGGWHYGADFMNKVEAALTPEARAVYRFLSMNYGAEWAKLNPVFRRVNGVNLPRHLNYWPLTVKPQQAGQNEIVDPVTGIAVAAGTTTPPSLRTRSQKIAEPDFRDALQVYIAHTKQIEHYIANVELVNEARAVLGNREVGNAIEAAASKQGTDVIRDWLTYLGEGGTREASAFLTLSEGMSKMAGRAATAAIIGRVGTLAIQSTQLAAAAAEMPFTSYVKRLTLLFAGQLGWGASLRSDYIQRRIKQMPPIVQQAMEGLDGKKPTRIKHAVARLGQLVAGTDGLFTAGTFAIVYDYQLKQARELGLSGPAAEAHALEAAERVTDRVAQPTRSGARSLFENRSTGASMRLAWSFASESRKNLGLLLAAGHSGMTSARFARAVLYAVVLNAGFAWVIRAAWQDARDGDDDELFDEKHWSLKRLALTMGTDWMQGLPILGSMVQAGAFKLTGEYIPEGNLFSSFERSIPALKRVFTEDIDERTLGETMRDVDLILQGLALSNDNLAAASSLTHLVKDGVGVVGNILGD